MSIRSIRSIYSYNGPVSGLLRNVHATWSEREPSEDELRLQNRRVWLRRALNLKSRVQRAAEAPAAILSVLAILFLLPSVGSFLL
jgi:hypothetical protein